MNSLIRYFAKQDVFSYIIVTFIFVVGTASFLMLRRELFPNVQFDIITVTTVYPGGSAEESEKLITNKIEQDLKEVDGIKKLTSVSAEGRSYVIAQLDPDQTTADDGKMDIQDVVDRITTFPSDADDPIVTSVESKLSPIIEVSLAGNLPEMELREIARDVKKKLERVSGVARVVENGMRDLEIRVEADLTKMEHLRITLDDLVRVLAGQNVSIPGGFIKTSTDPKLANEYLVRTKGDFQTLEDVQETVVRANDLGKSIRVKDIAKVRYALERAETYNRMDGKPSLGLTILKKETADAIDLVDAIRVRMSEIEPTLDQRVKVTLVNDTSYFIRRRLGVLTSNLGAGLIFVFIILALVLPMRVAFLVSLGIPFSFLGALIIFHATGVSLNLISLIGLIIVAGMLVDDAVVVTENAYRLMEEGMEPKEAAIRGTQQVWAPVFASVMTTVLAFAPLMFMSGIFGKFVGVLPYGVILALLMSMIEAYFVLPHHIGLLVRPRPKDSNIRPRTAIKRFLKKTAHVWDEKLVPVYSRFLEVAIARRYLIAVGTTGLLIFSLVFAATRMKLILFPPEGIETFTVKFEGPIGTSLERTSEIAKEIEKEVDRIPRNEMKNFVTRIGIQQSNPNDPDTKRGSEYGIIFVYLYADTDRERSAKEIMDELRDRVGQPEGLRKLAFEMIKPGPPQGKPISVGVRGKTYEEIMPAVRKLQERVTQIDGVLDVENTYVLGKEEIVIRVDPEEAAAAGLSVQNVGTTLRAAFEGLTPTSIQRLDEEVEIRVTLPTAQQNTTDSILKVEIPNTQGQLIPLSQIARLEHSQGIAQYEHENNDRQIKVLGEVDTEKLSATQATGIIRKFLPELEKEFPGVEFFFGGEDEDTQESMQNLMRAFVLAFFGIFLLLIMMFKSLIQPVLIVLTIPLGIIAVIWTFFFHGWPITFLGAIGMVALSGVIVNNAVVFIDFVNQLRAEGKGKKESILEAGRLRVRPIALTSLTTVVGILPTAYGIGGLDKFVVPIALALGWGVFAGSILALFVFPASLAILDDFQELMIRLLDRARKKHVSGAAPSMTRK